MPHMTIGIGGIALVALLVGVAVATPTTTPTPATEKPRYNLAAPGCKVWDAWGRPILDPRGTTIGPATGMTAECVVLPKPPPK